MVLALGVGQMVAFASSFYLFSVMADRIAADLHLPTRFIFGALSASFLISALAAAPTGRWLDRHGGRGLLLASSLVFAAGLVTLACCRGPVSLAAGALTLGAGMSIGLYETAFSILVALYAEEARRPITAVALIGGFGSTVGWPATLAMEEAFGWRGACLGWAAVHLLVCLPLAALAVPRVGGRGAHEAAGPPLPAPPLPAPHMTGFWDRRMIQLAGLFTIAWFISVCISAHLPRLLMRLGLTPAAAVGTAALVGVAAVSARLLEFTLLRRLPPLATTRVATLMHPLGGGAVLIFGVKAAALLALGQGAGNGMLAVAKGVLPLTLYGPRHYAYRSGLLSTPARFVQTGAPLLYGLILDRSAILALLTTCGLCLLMFLLTLGLKSHPAGPDEGPERAD
jgi:MFS family permease